MRNGILEVGDRVKSTRFAPSGPSGQLGTVFHVCAGTSQCKNR